MAVSLIILATLMAIERIKIYIFSSCNFIKKYYILLRLTLCNGDTMLVELKNTWFAPGGEIVKNGRPFSGVRYKQGEQEIPEYLKKDVMELVKKGMAKILDKNHLPPEPVVKKNDTLSDYDSYRRAADAEIKVRKEMSEQHKQNARERVAKAREVRLAKLAEKKKKEDKAA